MEAYEDSEFDGDNEIEDKWHGVPPVGERPAPSRTRFIAEIVGVLVVEFILWGIYRYFTAPIYGEGFNIPFFIGHIIAAPTIHLGPILLYWKFIRKERLFYKDDLENNKFMSFNLGPFKLTKKRLMTAVLVGLFGGIVWRMAEMVALNGSSLMMGGTEFATVKWLDMFAMAGMNFPTFFMMTFVMFFIVGPVEEFEFRAFTQDQSQRVLPKWAAIVFSSVFFGFSHIPIALFVYKMEPLQLIFAELSWMAAGATFGALYLWSRNIFAVIVMHGIGNWQLSVYWIQGRSTLTGLTETQGYIQSFAEAIFANAFMILVFYLIHKFYWGPQQRGEAAFGGKLMKIQQFFFSHDNGSRHIGVGTGSLSAITVIVLVILFSISAGVGIKDPMAIAPAPDDGGEDEIDLELYMDLQETVNDNQNLAEGGSYDYDLNSTKYNIIQKVSINLRWSDEADPPAPRIRPHENTPDTFNITVTGPNVTIHEEAANPQSAAGTLNVDVMFTDEQILELEGVFNLTVVVSMVDAGRWVPIIGPGALGLADRGNDYDITFTITRLTLEQDQGITEESSTEDEMFITYL